MIEAFCPQNGEPNSSCILPPRIEVPCREWNSNICLHNHRQMSPTCAVNSTALFLFIHSHCPLPSHRYKRFKKNKTKKHGTFRTSYLLLLFQFPHISFPHNCLQSTTVVTLLLFIHCTFFFHQSKIIGLSLYLSSVILEFDQSHILFELLNMHWRAMINLNLIACEMWSQNHKKALFCLFLHGFSYNCALCYNVSPFSRSTDVV